LEHPDKFQQLVNKDRKIIFDNFYKDHRREGVIDEVLSIQELDRPVEELKRVDLNPSYPPKIKKFTVPNIPD
jgi:hypothetical protein